MLVPVSHPYVRTLITEINKLFVDELIGLIVNSNVLVEGHKLNFLHDINKYDGKKVNFR